MRVIPWGVTQAESKGPPVVMAVTYIRTVIQVKIIQRPPGINGCGDVAVCLVGVGRLFVSVVYGFLWYRFGIVVGNTSREQKQ
jgi:hypothetical protein